MNQLETGEAPEAAHRRSDLQPELVEILRQRAAISLAVAPGLSSSLLQRGHLLSVERHPGAEMLGL